MRHDPKLRILCLGVLLAGGISAFSDTKTIEGLIQSRSGATMTVKTSDSNMVVLLNDDTNVGQVEGMLKVRHKEMSMAALIPGLQVKVEGTLDDQGQLVAKTVRFKGNDLERARSIQAGMHETQARSQENKADLAKQNAELEAQQASLKQQETQLQKQKGELTAQQQELIAQQKKVADNKAAIAAATARFGQLDDYYILDEVTVLFANGKVDLEAQYQPQLMALAKKAKTVQGYMVQVVGYASAVGSANLNQKLSEERAANVTNFLTQQGNIPLMNMLAPGAMGESRQVGDDKTAEGQAQNRRVVVRILQNKGIAGSTTGGD